MWIGYADPFYTYYAISFFKVQTVWINADIYIKQQRGKFSVLLSSHYIKQNLVSTVDEYESLDLITTLQIP